MSSNLKNSQDAESSNILQQDGRQRQKKNPLKLTHHLIWLLQLQTTEIVSIRVEGKNWYLQLSSEFHIHTLARMQVFTHIKMNTQTQVHIYKQKIGGF